MYLNLLLVISLFFPRVCLTSGMHREKKATSGDIENLAHLITVPESESDPMTA